MLPESRACASSLITDVLRAVFSPVAGLTAHERLLLAVLALERPEGGPVVRSHASLAASCGISVATVKRALAALVLRGVLAVERRADPSGCPAPSAYALRLAALGVGSRGTVPRSAGPDLGSPGTVGTLYTRASASDPDLGSGSDPEIDPRSESADPEHSRISPVGRGPDHAAPLGLDATRAAAVELGAALAASPTLAPLATAAVASRLAAAVVGARKPVALAVRGLSELADRIDDSTAAGCPWSREQIARSLRPWALAARAAPGETDDARAMAAQRRAVREALAPLERGPGVAGCVGPLRALARALG